jgi:hypothetical protein
MNSALVAVSLFAVVPVWELPTATWQVAPAIKSNGDIAAFQPKVTQRAAALLIPGLYPHPIRPEKALEPEMHEWCESPSPLVTNLAGSMDVFAFGYAQTTPLDAVCLSFGLRVSIEKLKAAGYEQIVLIGHSAGGIIARQYIERFPAAGVSKIVQISSPNTGSELADIKFGLPRTQIPFIKSIGTVARKDVVYAALPKDFQFACVVCKVPRLSNDFMVNLDSQWSEDLRKQGVPAVLVGVNHIDAPKSPTSAPVIADLVRGKLTRWTPEQTRTAEGIIFGKNADAAAITKRRERPILKKVGDLVERLVDDRIGKP